jgi:EAL and modified HD-GYP domain-containing signal transduction protein
MHRKSVSTLEENGVTWSEDDDFREDNIHEPSSLCSQEIFVARQPIYTPDLETFAYEILFHGGTSQQGETVKKYQATSQLIVNALLEIGLGTIVGQKRALISLSGGSLLLDYALALPADQVIIGVMGDAVSDSILLKRIRDLSAHGYLIAVDSLMAFEYADALGTIADIVTIDVASLDATTLAQRMAHVRHAEATLLARNVGTPDMFATCKRLGFTYFQGDFLCQPDVLKGRRSATNRLALLQLLAKLQDPDIEFSDVEALISRDASLSYKVLQVINSAFFSLPRKIDSLRQALLLLGLKTIMTWVSMIMLTGVDDKPYELLTTAMVRARMSELLAQAMKQDRKETFFLVGLFSVLDALMDTPMPEVLASLPLADEVVEALLAHEGLLGTVLTCTLAYEQGRWDDVVCPGLDHRAIMNAYLEATVWATEVGRTLTRL